MKNYFVIICLLILNLRTTALALDVKREAIVIVDGISTGVHLAPLFRGNGYHVIHVRSILGKKLERPFCKEDYILCFDESDDLVKKLKSLNIEIKAILPGAEPGVDLAEKLNAELKLPGNKPELSHTRRNKFHMHETLRQANVRSIKQLLTHSYEEVQKWLLGTVFPVVLKPVESAGTDNVHICNNEQEVKHAFQMILASDNIFKSKNQDVLCQEYIGGQEFMVNTVSREAVMRVVEVIKVHKTLRNNKPLYDYAEILNPEDEDFQIIRDYLEEVYQALGIQNGAGHAEVKIWERNGQKLAYLIEVAARPEGSASPSAIISAQSHSQISLLVNSIIHPESFKNISRDGIRPHHKVATIYFISPISGKMQRDLNPNLFKHLKTFYHLHFSYKRGDLLPITADLMNIPGYIYLVGTPDDIQKDMATIRMLEETLYTQLISH